MRAHVLPWAAMATPQHNSKMALPSKFTEHPELMSIAIEVNACVRPFFMHRNHLLCVRLLAPCVSDWDCGGLQEAWDGDFVSPGYRALIDAELQRAQPLHSAYDLLWAVARQIWANWQRLCFLGAHNGATQDAVGRL